MKKTVLSLILATLMLTTLVLSACSQPAASSDGGTASPATSTPASPAPTTGGEELTQQPLPLSEERIEISILTSPHPYVVDITTNYVTEWLEEKTNVHINWIMVDASDFATKLTLLMSNPDQMPDVIMSGLTRDQVDAYGAQGLLAPLGEYIDTASVNYKKIIENNPKILNQSTSYDGNIYFLPRYYETVHTQHINKQWINQKWLDNLGLEMPTTIDEFYNVLKAFKEEDANGNGNPNDEIPFIGTQLNIASWPINQVMNAFTYTPQISSNYTVLPMIVEDGTVTTSIVQDGWREGMEFFAKLYAEGLLDEESLTITSEQVRALSGDPNGNRIGSFPGHVASLNVASDTEDIHDYVTIPPLKGPSGLQVSPLNAYTPAPFYMVTTKCENPEVAFRLADYMMTDVVAAVQDGDYELLNLWYGPEDDPQGWSKAEDGETGFTGNPAYFKWNFAWGDMLNTHWYETFPINMRREWKEMMSFKQEPGAYNQEKVLYEETVNNYAPYSEDKSLPVLSMKTEEAAEYAALQAALATYFNESVGKFITGEWDPETYWDTYLGELENIGLSRALAIAQEAYDRMYK